MLTISEKTMAVLGAVEDRKFATTVVQFLREEVDELSDEPLGSMLVEVEKLIARARGYGLISERGIVVFALAAAYLGLDFDTDFPPVNAVLAADDMSEIEKMGWLEGWSLELFERLAD